MKHLLLALAAVAFVGSVPATAQQAAPPPKKMIVEIYRIAPGQHENFMRLIALFDEANRRADLPPRQLYVHEDGAGWDFMLIQPADVPEDKQKALADAYKSLKTPSGPNFFVTIRSYMADHTDTFVSGPTSASDWLKKLDESRKPAR